MKWMRWDKLCDLKSKGGMGFRDLKVFNQALLAKQGWRLIHNQGSMVHNVVKAKYFRGCDYIDAYLGGAPSFTWRSIWSARALLVEGVKWRVGNGQKICISNDSWLAEDPYYVPAPNLDCVNEGF